MTQVDNPRTGLQTTTCLHRLGRAGQDGSVDAVRAPEQELFQRFSLSRLVSNENSNQNVYLHPLPLFVWRWRSGV